LTSPHGQQIRFDYDNSNRIVQASDNAGQTMDYVYDEGGRLERVMRSGRLERRYSYESTYMMKVEDGAGHKLLVNDYDETGRIAKLTLADGSAWHLRYTYDNAGRVTATELTDPSGREIQIELPKPQNRVD
jgi:YD repeat-containing protein